jgi:hypothetical protein
MFVWYDIADDLDLVAAEIDDRLRHWPKRDLIDLANRGIQLIQERTESGRDMRGDMFEPYSEEWAEVRRETGRNTDVVDLLYEGHMRANMTPKADRGEAVIFFPDSIEGMKAMAHHEGTETLPERAWFGFQEGTSEHNAMQQEALFLASQRIEAAAE